MERRPTPTDFLHRDDGAAAVEFGLVVLPFLALLGAILQLAFMMWAQQNLDFTVQRAVRTLFTGQFQADNSGTTGSAALLSALKAKVCGPASSTTTLFDCATLKMDVTVGTSFGTIAPPVPVDPSTKDWSTGFGTHYSCAAPGSIVIATAAVKFPVFFKLMNAGLANFADGSKLLQSTVVFRTEPYGTSTC